MNGRQQLNRLFLLATAPFLGMMIWMFSVQASQLMPSIEKLERPAKMGFDIHEQAASLEGQLSAANKDGAWMKETIQKYFDIYSKSSKEVAGMLKIAVAQAERPGLIFDNRISTAFGRPIKKSVTQNLDLKLYSFREKDYKGYALKAVLKSDSAMKLVLGKDKIGSSGETTLSAASRYGAVAGVNAGGFADNGRGKRYPIGNTVYEGRYVYGFYPTHDGLAFVGLNKDRKLIGGRFDTQEELDKLQPTYGATFVPVLLKNGRKEIIPTKWMTRPYRAPRTVVGRFNNDQILFIVTEGYDEEGNSGASLSELQDIMQQLGIRDAYNLDGGGSSTLVWDGQVINHPSDGRMRPMPTHFLFFK